MSIRQYMIDYSNLVLDGSIVACKKHKWACKRFLRDLEKENTKDFPYVFDEDKALNFIEWMEEFKHTKGPLQGQNIDPAPIQIFVFGNIYGWYKVYKDGSRSRRFSRSYWQVARKNAKSQGLGTVGSYECSAFGVNESEVYIGATKKDQADIVYREIKSQIFANDFLKDKFKEAYGKIKHLKSNSFIQSLSKDTGKNGDGFNPQCNIIDEYHAHPTSEILDVLTSGQGARNDPLTFIITTAGFNLNHPCYRVEYKLVSAILDPDKVEENEEYFIMINELDEGDSIDDESVWEKANPIVCSYEKGWENLRREYKLAKQAPEKMRNFLTKNMNIWVNQADNGYMDMKYWTKCHELNPVMPDLTGKAGYNGDDLSQKHDLTTAAFCFPLDNEYFAILQHSFLPRERLEERMRSDGVPYDLWADMGYLTLTEGEVIDYRYVMEHIRNRVEQNKWNVKEICYDPWSATQFAQEMETEGFEPVEIIQGTRTLSEPTKDFRNKVLEGKIIHGDDPLLRWCVGNAVVKMDAQGNIMLDKAKSTNRIDALAAVINAFVRARNHHLNDQDVSSHFLNGWKL